MDAETRPITGQSLANTVLTSADPAPSYLGLLKPALRRLTYFFLAQLLHYSHLWTPAIFGAWLKEVLKSPIFQSIWQSFCPSLVADNILEFLKKFLLYRAEAILTQAYQATLEQTPKTASDPSPGATLAELFYRCDQQLKPIMQALKLFTKSDYLKLKQHWTLMYCSEPPKLPFNIRYSLVTELAQQSLGANRSWAAKLLAHLNLMGAHQEFCYQTALLSFFYALESKQFCLARLLYPALEKNPQSFSQRGIVFETARKFNDFTAYQRILADLNTEGLLLRASSSTLSYLPQPLCLLFKARRFEQELSSLQPSLPLASEDTGSLNCPSPSGFKRLEPS